MGPDTPSHMQLCMTLPYSTGMAVSMHQQPSSAYNSSTSTTVSPSAADVVRLGEETLQQPPSLQQLPAASVMATGSQGITTGQCDVLQT